jgi:methylmalonyl-CoA mutase cobalamin-binding domain/chain
MATSLAEALADFKKDLVLDEVNSRLEQGEDAVTLIGELQAGMNTVGERFSEGNYYLSELMMSASLFTEAMAILEPRMEADAQDTIGSIVVGTPKGDIHDLGKNIFCTVAKGAGFEIHDLGVDVPVENFIAKIEEVKPDVVGFSALITTAFEPMKEIVDALVEKGLRDDIKVIVGGGVTTETVQRHVGADAQSNDAVEGVELCKGFVGAGGGE